MFGRDSLDPRREIFQFWFRTSSMSCILHWTNAFLWVYSSKHVLSFLFHYIRITFPYVSLILICFHFCVLQFSRAGMNQLLHTEVEIVYLLQVMPWNLFFWDHNFEINFNSDTYLIADRDDKMAVNFLRLCINQSIPLGIVDPVFQHLYELFAQHLHHLASIYRSLMHAVQWAVWLDLNLN